MKSFASIVYYGISSGLISKKPEQQKKPGRRIKTMSGSWTIRDKQVVEQKRKKHREYMAKWRYKIKGKA